jgi:ABC-type antimicrobial peptide transport system permease subunit
MSGMKEPAWLLGIFALLSALLAALGLYGIVSHSVTQRQREIGIRMALGARSSEVLSMVVGNVMITIAAGLIIGLGGALLVTRVTRTLLFEVSPFDPIAFAIAAVAMAAIGVLAAAIPARRATHVDPTTALRSE